MRKDLFLTFGGLSPEIQGIIKHFSNVTNSPSNFIVTSMLAAVGAVAGKRLMVRDRGYTNYGQMYACLVAPPGIGKSPAMDIAMKPILVIAYRSYDEYMRENKIYQKAVKQKIDMDKPVLHKTIAQDTTMEKLIRDLADNPNGIILYVDELTDLTSNLNRYNNGNNFPKFLQMWSNGTVILDRKSDESVVVDNPYLSILSSTQPVNISKIFRQHTGNGFFARWLFCLPNGKPNIKTEPNQEYYEYWSKVIDAIANMPAVELTFADDVIPLLDSFDDERETEAESLGETEPEVAEMLMKSKYNIRRIAAIVHLISAECDIIKGVPASQITKMEFQQAENMVDFYEKCAREVLAMSCEKRVSTMSTEKIIQELNSRKPITNITQFAEAIGVSRQYVSAVLLRKGTSGLLQKEAEDRKMADILSQFIYSNCPRLFRLAGRPTPNIANAMLSAAQTIDKVKATLTRMEQTPGIDNVNSDIYTILFSQFLC